MMVVGSRNAEVKATMMMMITVSDDDEGELLRCKEANWAVPTRFPIFSLCFYYHTHSFYYHKNRIPYYFGGAVGNDLFSKSRTRKNRESSHHDDPRTKIGDNHIIFIYCYCLIP